MMFAPLHPTGVMLKWDTKAPEIYREPTRMDECKEWLEDLLRANPEGLKAREVIAMGKEEGFSRDMLYRAQKELRAHIQNTEGHKSPQNRWKWSDQVVEVEEYEDD